METRLEEPADPKTWQRVSGLRSSAREGLAGLIFTWAGAAIAGNLIAAPAKFQAPSLTLPVALDVGRMQFHWIGIAEAMLVLGILLALFVARHMPSRMLTASIALFALQKLWILPMLNARTMAIIAGQPVEDSALHLVYVAVEILKAGLLIWAGVSALRAIAPEQVSAAID